LDGKDAEGTKQLRKVWDRSPNPAPDCFFDLSIIALSGDKLQVRTQKSWPVFYFFWEVWSFLY